MSRQFHSRDKKVWIEQNLATNEKEHIGNRNHEFDLRDNPQDSSPDYESPSSHSRRQTLPETFSQNQDLAENQPIPSSESFSKNQNFNQEQNKWDSARETQTHSYKQRSPEDYFQNQKPPISRIAEDSSTSDSSAFSMSETQEQENHTSQSRLKKRDSPRSREDARKPETKRKQKGTKYQQKFVADAAKALKNEQADSSDLSETVNEVEETVSAPKSEKPSRLKFAKDENSVSRAKMKSNKKLLKSELNASKRNIKLEAAQEKISKKKVKNRVIIYDEEKKKSVSKMQFEKVPLERGEKRFKPPAIIGKPVSAIKGGAKIAGGAAYNKIHQKVSEVEDENVATKTAHHSEKIGERAVGGGTRSAYRFVKDSPYRKVEKLERKAMKADTKYAYQKALDENPQLKSNKAARFMQKRKLKKQYAKSYRDAKKSEQNAKNTGSAISKAAKAVKEFTRKHPALVTVVSLILFVVCFLSSILSSCSNMATGILSSVVGSSYLAEDSDINNAELIYTEWETDLQIQINNSESDNAGYDEYRYNVPDIGHNPFELMGYLTAVYQNFSYSEAESALREIFNEQYNLAFVPEIEIRTRTVTYTDPETGEVFEFEEEYDWHILNVNLSARSFSEVIFSKMTLAQKEMFELYMQTKGNRQYITNPCDFNWLPNVTSAYGWRIHPISGEKNLHKGIDIAVPIGTDIMAGMDGVVVSAGYDDGGYGYYVIVEDDDGFQACFAHCDSILSKRRARSYRRNRYCKIG